ncbi:MAG TPA: nucleoside-diphosphate sugar epimerase/dehydratase [Magnetospirillum sp.]|nr:nucleoside-diphosphate sugar epimerase/dehydratase [Magnetospirillum sp.]
MPVLSRANIAFLHDILWAALSPAIALALRVGDLGPYGGFLTVATPTFTAVAIVTFRATGMYRGVWRYASINDLITITRGIGISILVALPVLFLMNRLDGMPRSLPLIQMMVLLVLLGAPRLLYRAIKDNSRQRRRAASGQAVPVLLVGADDQADMFIRHCAQAPDAGYHVVAIIGRDASRVGRKIHGVEVICAVAECGPLLARLKGGALAPQRLLLSSEITDGDLIRELLEVADEHGMSLARLPRMTDFREAEDRVQVRPIAVEDLLGRPQVVLDRAGISRLIANRRVLVTGAGGSIGSELVRQIATLGPSRLVLVEASEFALYTIDMEVAERFPAVDRRAVIANVRDRAVIDGLFAEERPDLVFHAAALKHVPLVEGNPVEGILTNAIGSRNVAQACVAAGVRAMVMISTDKAVNPTNVMGASKRVAESYCQALDLTQTGTCFVTVRFGNVLGSTGSVVPRFQAQLAAGGPITVTHPDMERYFMTIREAVELVLQASSMAVQEHHDHGKIYVLDMGKPVKIVELARQMIRLAGLRPDHDVRIVFSGLRPGEKLFEEIFHGAEAPVPTQAQGVLLASPRLVDIGELSARLAELENACLRRDTEAATALVQGLVPEFTRGLAPAG